MTEEPETYDDALKEALKQASGELAADNLESFALVTFDGDVPKVTMEADQHHEPTGMPMPQMLLATLIYDLSQRANVEPLRIGQAATYAAEQMFNNRDVTDAEWVRDMDEELGWDS
jgi:Cu/Ag efflux protein CusF